MKILTVVGARPQFVKAGVVSREILIRQQAGVSIQEVIVHTGQHFDDNMSQVFFEELSLPRPVYNLGLGGLSHGAMTGRMLEELEKLVIHEAPDWVMVYGDTNSTLAGAMAAAKLHKEVAHVEAGLRSFNRAMPEEINRIVTDHVSTLLFAPTQTAMNNLAREGVASEKVVFSGDVMKDAAGYYGAQVAGRPLPPPIDRQRPFILTTLHRAENTDQPDRLAVVIAALMQLSRRHQIVLPLHPRTRGAIEALGQLEALSRALVVIDPVGYLDMVALEQACQMIVTDSGGVQKEAYFFGKACVTLRGETEWQELVAMGANRLVEPRDPGEVCVAVEGMIGRSISDDSDCFGSGAAAAVILNHLQG